MLEELQLQWSCCSWEKGKEAQMNRKKMAVRIAQIIYLKYTL